MNKIAIIDTGICVYPHVILDFNLMVTEKGEVIEDSAYIFPDGATDMEYNHANVCYDIIKKYAPKSVIGHLRILNKPGNGNISQLISALYFCFNHGIKLVNLSLGSIDFHDFEPLQKCVNETTSRGMLIVAACHNGNAFTYPAALANVIGVRTQKGLSGDKFFFFKSPFDGINISAASKHQIQNPVKEYITPLANSFAAPLITSIIYNQLEENNINHAGKALSYLAKRWKLEKNSPVFHPRRPDWINKALLITTKNEKELPDLPQAISVLSLAENKLSSLLSNQQELGDYVEEYDTVVFDVGEIDSIKPLTLSKNTIIFTERDEISNCINVEEGYFRWEATNDGWSFDYVSDIKENEAPIVLISGHNEKNLLYLLNRLKTVFREKDYYAVTMTDSVYGVLWDFEYLSNKDCLCQINAISRLYSANIILIGISNVSEATGKINSDVDLIIDSSKFADHFCLFEYILHKLS